MYIQKNSHSLSLGTKKNFIKLATKCLSNDEEINKKYNLLKNKLSGSIDLSLPNIIPDTIEKFLI